MLICTLSTPPPDRSSTRLDPEPGADAITALGRVLDSLL